MPYRIPLTKEELEREISEIGSLARVFDLINVHAVITDEHGNILYMNRAAEEKTGYTLAEAVGKNPGDLWGGNESEEFYKNLWSTIKATKKSFVGQLRNRRKDGSELYQQINITPILDENGNITHYIAIEADLTQARIKENELQAKIDSLFSSAVDRELKMSYLKSKLPSLVHEEK